MRRTKLWQSDDAARLTRQLGLPLAPPPKHGGARPGAGRPPKALNGANGANVPKGTKRSPIPHRARPSHRKGDPVHVTLRTLEGAPRLRAQVPEKVVKAALLAQRKKLAAEAKEKGQAYFQVVHFSILDNHVHLVVEASDKRMLARGVAGLEVRIARRLNARVGRSGSLWSGRYHRRDIRTPSEVRGVLRYVLANARKHYRHFGDRAFADPCSSAPTFDGFSRPPFVFDDQLPWPRVAPRTWLLGVGWRRHGLLDPADSPAARGSTLAGAVRRGSK